MKTFEEIYKLQEMVDENYWENWVLNWIKHIYKNKYTEDEMELIKDAAVGAVLAVMEFRDGYHEDMGG